MPAFESKPLPTDLSFDGLFAPNSSYEYFKDAGRQAFRFDATGYESVNAWWLAEASLLIYVQEQDYVRQRLADAGLPHCHFIEDAETDTQSFVTHNDDFAIVCFRGTESNLKDLLTDADLKLIDSGHGGKVHSGFKKALDSVWPQISSQLDRITNHGSSSIKVWFTGHSLGAGLATLAAARYSSMQGIYAIASPRTGDKSFCSTIRPDNFWRVVNNNDIVTMVPPKVRYRHAGNLVYIDANGLIHHKPSFMTRFKSWFSGHIKHPGILLKSWMRGRFDSIPMDSLNDHGPMYYVVYIWNQHIKQL